MLGTVVVVVLVVKLMIEDGMVSVVVAVARPACHPLACAAWMVVEELERSSQEPTKEPMGEKQWKKRGVG